MAEQEFTAEELANETWKTVNGFQCRYEVSSLGRVRSLSSQFGLRRAPLILKLRNHKGYRAVMLQDSKFKIHKFVHHLVLDAFVGPRPEGTECCHGDGVKSNNRLRNLRWDTHKSNVADQVKHGTFGLRARPETLRPRPKLTVEQVRTIRAKHKPFVYTYPMLAAEYGVAWSTIKNIVNRTAWPNV